MGLLYLFGLAYYLHKKKIIMSTRFVIKAQTGIKKTIFLFGSFLVLSPLHPLLTVPNEPD